MQRQRQETQKQDRLRQEEYERRRAEREARYEQEEKERKANLLVTNADKYAQERQQLNDLSMFNNKEIVEFRNMCDYYGLPVFDGDFPISIWESSFLLDIRRKMASGNELTPNQLKTLKNICSNEPATSKQVQYLENLGYEGSFDGITKRKASIMITNKKQYDTFEGEQ